MPGLDLAVVGNGAAASLSAATGRPERFGILCHAVELAATLGGGSTEGGRIDVMMGDQRSAGASQRRHDGCGAVTRTPRMIHDQRLAPNDDRALNRHRAACQGDARLWAHHGGTVAHHGSAVLRLPEAAIVDAPARNGHPDAARAVLRRSRPRRNHAGLLSEDMEPAADAPRGDFAQSQDQLLLLLPQSWDQSR